MSSFFSKMEGKNSGSVSPQYPAWLQSAQIQFLSGCFFLETPAISSQTGFNYEMHHYMVLYLFKTIIDLIFYSRPLERNLMCFCEFNFALMIVFITLSSCRLQTGTRSASVEKQQQLQSAAHTFYQQVVCVLKQRALIERERPGLFFSLVFNDTTLTFLFI